MHRHTSFAHANRQRRGTRTFANCLRAWIAGAALIGLGAGASPKSQRAGSSDDAWADVAKIVQRHLAADPSYQAGDLISQRNVEPIFEELLSLGFQPANHEELYDSVLPDQDRLVQLFNTHEGRKFIRKVSKLPYAYDRLERMTWTDVGRKLLDELVTADDGAKQFSAINSPDGLRKLQKLVEQDPRGRNLALPTGNIHTAEDLLQQLRESKFLPKKSAAR